ncbi:hypothetical protein [Methanolobus sp. ZRKC2]
MERNVETTTSIKVKYCLTEKGSNRAGILRSMINGARNSTILEL